MKQDLLREDLALMDRNIDNVSICSFIPEIKSIYEALGVLYVFEGSTLGGQVIYKHLLEKNDFPQKNQLKFHFGYGTETGKMWMQFKEVLRLVPESHQVEVIIAAKTTFKS